VLRLLFVDAAIPATTVEMWPADCAQAAKHHAEALVELEELALLARSTTAATGVDGDSGGGAGDGEEQVQLTEAFKIGLRVAGDGDKTKQRCLSYIYIYI
jgi:hypothetical protein